MQQIPLYYRMVAERLHAVGDGRTMVLHGRRTFVVVFSSCQPIVLVTGRRLFGDPVSDLLETSWRPVTHQLPTSGTNLRDRQRLVTHRSVTGHRWAAIYVLWSVTVL